MSHNSPMGDVSQYYKHSMVEDPWAPLEHRLALTASRAAAHPARTALQLSDSDDLEKGRGASASDESEAEPASSDTA
jgi:M-phase-specific PLK1-interacting protein